MLESRFGKVMTSFYKANIYCLRRCVHNSTLTAAFWTGRRDGIWPFKIKFALEILVCGLSEGGPPPPSTLIN